MPDSTLRSKSIRSKRYIPMSEKTDLLILGDICPVDEKNNSLHDSFNAKYVQGICNIIKDTDYVIGNLEAPVIATPSPSQKCGPTLHVEPPHLDTLKHIGINSLSVANNHILDHGPKGLKSTLTYLAERGIDVWGYESNEKCNNDVLNVTLNDTKIAIFALAEKEFNYESSVETGACLFDPYIHLSRIQKAKHTSDYVIVLYHGGIEHYVYPSPVLQKKCRAMVEMGADCVLCQHSHCIGSIEQYHDSVILYGQGNSIFGYREGNKEWNHGLAVRISPQNKKVNFIPICMTANGCETVQPDNSNNLLSKLQARTPLTEDKKFITQQWNKFTKGKTALYLAMLMGKNRIFNKINRLLNNLLLSVLVSKSQLRTILNLIRCDAHREVLISILEQEIDKKK